MYYDPAATGERIQNLRKDREVTQEQLAIDLNISDRYMRNLEKGEKVPSVDLFVELRERFGSSLDYIVLGVSASQREQELQNQLQMLRKELKEMARFLALYQGEYSRDRLILRLRTVHPKTITRLAQNDTGNVADRHMKQILSIYNGAGRAHSLPCKR